MHQKLNISFYFFHLTISIIVHIKNNNEVFFFFFLYLMVSWDLILLKNFLCSSSPSIYFKIRANLNLKKISLQIHNVDMKIKMVFYRESRQFERHQIKFGSILNQCCLNNFKIYTTNFKICVDQVRINFDTGHITLIRQIWYDIHWIAPTPF